MQILWVNLVTDGVCTIPLGLEPKHRDVLTEPPRRAKTGIIYSGMLARIAFMALIMSMLTFFVFLWQLPLVGLEKARAIAFTSLVAMQWFNAINARSDRQSIFKLGFFSNRLLIGGIAAAVLLQLMVIYLPPLQNVFYTVPLTAYDWSIILLLALVVLVVEELRKFIAPKLFSRGL